jgi:hypothetical protein
MKYTRHQNNPILVPMTDWLTHSCSYHPADIFNSHDTRSQSGNTWFFLLLGKEIQPVLIDFRSSEAE